MDLKNIKPGRYADITLDQYHNECGGWSKSNLDKVHRSMAHYLLKEKEETDSLSFGAAFHCAVLTPDLFDSEYVVAPKCDMRTKIGKEAMAAFEAENRGKLFISESDFTAINRMTIAILDHPIAKDLFVGGDAEHSFFWHDEDTGLLCKNRPDYLRKDGICIDIKSTKNASYDEFKWDVKKYRYHVQNAYFVDGLAANGIEVKEFLFCAVESVPPYNVNVFTIDETSVSAGRAEYKEDLKTINKYYNTDEKSRWAGYSPKVQVVSVPMWK